MRRTLFFAGMAAVWVAGSLLFSASRLAADVPATAAVYSYHGDNMRTGWYNHETILTQATVSTTQFGRLWD